MSKAFHMRAVYHDTDGNVRLSVEVAPGAQPPADEGKVDEWGIYYRDHDGLVWHERECISRAAAERDLASLQWPRFMLVLGTDGTEQRIPFEGFEPDLKDLQRLVGGHIEHVQVWHDGRELSAFINEEGKLNGMADNPRATTIYCRHRYKMIEADEFMTQAEREHAKRALARRPDFIMGPMVVLVIERPQTEAERRLSK